MSAAMFKRRCDNEEPHAPHTYTQHWVQADLPMLPDHVASQLSDEWDSDYRCPGIKARPCAVCGTELAIDIIKVHETAVFCPNDACKAFAQSFWVKK